MASGDARGGLDALPSTFRWSDAREAGISQSQLYGLLEDERIERIGHGLYRKSDAEPTDLDLIEIASVAERATVCLASALARHDLTDLLPSRIHVAVPRGAHRPTIGAPVAWHQFQPDTFEVGRETLPLSDGWSIGLYGPERSIIDAYRLRHQVGHELGRRALRTWLGRSKSQPSVLLALAEQFPKARSTLRDDLEVLLT